MKVNLKKLVNLFYTALMTFLVFTFADNLIQGLVKSFYIDLFLYTLMWLFLVLQTTFAYVHICNIKSKDYTVAAFISDSIDIGIAIYVCAAIGSTNTLNGYIELNNYRNLTVPFIILAINQFVWYIIVREFNVPALFRICLLFFGMLAITISEWLCHSFWNMVAIVSLVVLLGIIRIIDKAPPFFCSCITNLWNCFKKKKYNSEIIFTKLYSKNEKTINYITFNTLADGSSARSQESGDFGNS